MWSGRCGSTLLALFLVRQPPASSPESPGNVNDDADPKDDDTNLNSERRGWLGTSTVAYTMRQCAAWNRVNTTLEAVPVARRKGEAGTS
jgi:hypothetical protein